MSFWLGNETVSFSGMKADLDSEGTAVGVSSGSFAMGSSQFWLNGGSASANGLTSYSEDFRLGRPVGTSSATVGYRGHAHHRGQSGQFHRDRDRARQHERFGERPECHHQRIDGAVGTFNSRIAATYTWNGSSSGSWSTVGNWNLRQFCPGSRRQHSDDQRRHDRSRRRHAVRS